MDEALDFSDRTARIARTAAALFSIQGVTWLSTALWVTIVPRSLGPDDFGILTTASTFAFVLAAIAGLGTGNLLVKSAARDPRRTKEIVKDTVVLRLVAWTGLAGASLLVATVFLESSLTVWFVVLLAILGVPFALTVDSLVGGLQANHRLGRTSARLAGLGLLTQLSLVTVLSLGGSLVEVATVGFLAGALALLLGWWGYRREGLGGASQVSAPIGKRMFRLAGEARTYFAWDVGQRLYAAVPIFVISTLGGASAAGAYGVAYKLINIPIFVTTIITMSVYPDLSALATTNLVRFRQLIRGALSVMLVVTIPMATVIGLSSEGLLSTLTGQDFADAWKTVAVLSVGVPLVSLNTIVGMGLFALDRQRRMTLMIWFATAVNLALLFGTYFCLSSASRANEFSTLAALLTVGVEACTSLLIVHWSSRLVGGIIPWPTVCKTLLGATVALAIGWLASRVSASWPIAAVTSTAAYLAVMQSLGGFPIGVDEIRRSIRNRHIAAVNIS